MDDKEFELELERRFDRLWREVKAAGIVREESERRHRDLRAKLYAMAAVLYGEDADTFIKGYPENGKPHLKEKG